MNYKLIMLPNPIVVKEEDGLITKGSKLYIIEDEPYEIIAGIEGLPTVNLSLVADEIGLVDVESKVKEIMGLPNYLRIKSMSPTMKSSFEFGVECFKAAQSLNEKKFSEEELEQAMARIALFAMEEGGKAANRIPQIVKELSQPKVYNVELEVDCTLVGLGLEEKCKPKITNNSITITKVLK